MIRTENLTKSFGGGRGVDNVNLDVPRGAIYGFVGRNGAGKTTTIKMLCGLLRQDSGRAFIGDLEVLPKNISKIKSLIGYMPDITGVYEQMSVWEFLDFYGAAFKIAPKLRAERIESALAITKASHMIDYQMTSLSRGMRQRVGLAKTLVHDPEVLILDEPAGGLDPMARVEMRRTIEALKGYGKTILLSSHILPELASICDVVGIIEGGKLLAQGTVKEIGERMKEDLVILVTVDSDVDAAAELLGGVEGVGEVKKVEREQLSAVYSGGRETLGDVLALLIKNGVKVRLFEESEIDLEDVYMNIAAKDQGKDQRSA